MRVYGLGLNRRGVVLNLQVAVLAFLATTANVRRVHVVSSVVAGYVTLTIEANKPPTILLALRSVEVSRAQRPPPFGIEIAVQNSTL